MFVKSEMGMRCTLKFLQDHVDLAVHVFAGHPDLRPFHGKTISRARFRLEFADDIEEPERRLMRWHYHHSVLKSLRGFWVSPLSTQSFCEN